MNACRIGSLALAALALCGATSAAEARTTPLRVEPLYSAMVTAGGLHVTAPSNGCTSKASFAVTHDAQGGGAVVYLVRSRPDLCRAYLPAGVSLDFTWQDLGLAPGDQVRVGNAVVNR